MNGNPDDIAYIAGREYKFHPCGEPEEDWVSTDEKGIEDHHWDYNGKAGMQHHFCFPEEYIKPPSDVNLWEM